MSIKYYPKIVLYFMKLTPVPNIVIKWIMNSIAMAALGGELSLTVQHVATTAMHKRKRNIACNIACEKTKQDAQLIACNDCHWQYDAILNCPLV